LRKVKLGTSHSDQNHSQGSVGKVGGIDADRAQTLQLRPVANQDEDPGLRVLTALSTPTSIWDRVDDRLGYRLRV
jgi:hypothetical protein